MISEYSFKPLINNSFKKEAFTKDKKWETLLKTINLVFAAKIC